MSANLPRLSSVPLEAVSASWLLVGVNESPELSSDLRRLDEALDGALTRLRNRGDLTGKVNELTCLPLAPGIQADRLMVVGLGRSDALSAAALEQALSTGIRKAAGTADASLAVALPREAMERLGTERAIGIVSGAAAIGSVGPDLYKAESEKHPFREIRIMVDSETDIAQQAVDRGWVLGEAINLTRELVNRHPEEIYPDTFATRAAKEAGTFGIRGEILNQRQMEQEKMNALLAVARGSAHEPRVVVLEYSGADPKAPLLAFCGKGVTFDSGGLSLKPSSSMLAMKADMAGAATVLGAMTAIARLKLPVNVLGVMGLVENMVGPHSYKLGEILRARNGVTIEVQNTDAEGRLVLADILSYAVDRKPSRMIDLATLTGSCVVALGEDVAGAFANNQDWCNDVLRAAELAGEEIWQMPMFESYAEQLKCDFADIKNVGGKWGGAITAAKFLERFVSDVPWVHLDIAGPSYVENGKPYRDVGGTGFGVRTLVEVAEAFGATHR